MKNPKEITIESYNKTAEEYAARVEGLFLEKQAERFLSYLSESSSILDLGCGSGRDAKAFTEMGYRVVGVDLSSGLLDIARRNAPEADFRLMDITDLNFPDNYFDGVWAVGSLLHIPKKEIPDVVERIYRMLKPKGAWHMSAKKGVGELLKQDGRYGGLKKFWSFFQQGELEAILKGFNFTVLESYLTEAAKQYSTDTWINILCRK